MNESTPQRDVLSTKGTPTTPQELAGAAYISDPPYQLYLILLALSQILERIEAIDTAQSEFQCHGGKRFYG